MDRHKTVKSKLRGRRKSGRGDNVADVAIVGYIGKVTSAHVVRTYLLQNLQLVEHAWKASSQQLPHASRFFGRVHARPSRPLPSLPLSIATTVFYLENRDSTSTQQA